MYDSKINSNMYSSLKLYIERVFSDRETNKSKMCAAAKYQSKGTGHWWGLNLELNGQSSLRYQLC